MSRASAATRLPGLSRRMSPGTTSCALISVGTPSRRTKAIGCVKCFSEWIIRSEWFSVVYPMMALITTTPIITPASANPPVAMESPAARLNNATGNDLNWCMKMLSLEREADSGSWFGPYFCKVSSTLWWERPVAGDVCRVAITELTSTWCQGSTRCDWKAVSMWVKGGR